MGYLLFLTVLQELEAMNTAADEIMGVECLLCFIIILNFHLILPILNENALLKVLLNHIML